MHRFFGSSKPQLDKPNLQSAIKNADERVSGIDLKIKKLEAELIRYKEQLKKLPNGSTRNNVQQKCTKLLQQRNMYNRQKEQIENQIFSMEQTEFTTENIKNSITTVKAMKEASKELKREYKKVNIEQIESLQDELADLIEDSSYIQEALGRGYEVPDDIDESELQAELDALGDELTFEESEGIPSYLQENDDKMPEFLDELNQLETELPNLEQKAGDNKLETKPVKAD